MPKPFRRYAVGNVWRNEKPGPGRFRQFMQFDADTVGAESVAADAEMCMLAADTLEALGIKRGDYVIKVNNRKVLDGVLEVDRTWRRRERRQAADRACARSTSSIGLGVEAFAQLLGQGPQGRERRFHQGRWTQTQIRSIVVT